MTSTRTPRSLSLTTSPETGVERDKVTIDDVEYQVKLPTDFLRNDLAQFQTVEALWANTDKEQVDVAVIDDVIYRVLSTAFLTPVPAEVYDKMSNDSLTQLANFVRESWESRREA